MCNATAIRQSGALSDNATLPLYKRCIKCNHSAMNAISPLGKYRRDKGLTLDELAARLSPAVTKGTVSRWENGVVRIPVERVEEIERLTGISRKKLRPDVFQPTPAEASR